MKRLTWAAALLTALAACLAACGSNNSGGGTSSSTSGTSASTAGGCNVGQGTSGNGAAVKIGSKPFAEQRLLATMTKLVLEKNGFSVDFTTQADDPAIDQALSSGTIDMLWQYTGTELQTILKLDSIPTDLTEAFALAKEKDAAKNLCWVAPAPLNDTNGLAIKTSDKSKYGSTLTDLGNYLKQNPTTAVCIKSEFRTRADGLPGLQKVYDSGYATATYKDVGGPSEGAIATGDCPVGQVYTTDSAIAANNLTALADDKKLFPPDNVGLIVRSSTLQKYPAIANLMTPVAAKLTTDEITNLNKQVEVDKMNVNDVSRNWLTQNGFLK
ncbi:MAG TPA: glycine betaine ABC transporter substrate-binding protein [Dehalococcoidia bacterium]|nr:glycine betaine ABC transporter substrate-binding protein [Dehalococcoidia bacterium]